MNAAENKEIKANLFIKNCCQKDEIYFLPKSKIPAESIFTLYECFLAHRIN